MHLKCQPAELCASAKSLSVLLLSRRRAKFDMCVENGALQARQSRTLRVVT